MVADTAGESRARGDDAEASPLDGPWLEAVRRVVATVGTSDVAELSLSSGTFRVHIRRRVGALSAVGGPEAGPPGSSGQDARWQRVVAPLTGVFYRSPSPTARPYVEVGDLVDADSVVGLIETMKIFNEVTADRPGRVVEALAEGGQLVHAGETLYLLDPSERSAVAPVERYA